MADFNTTHSNLAWHAEARRLRAEDPRRWTIRALAAHFGKARATVGEVFKAAPRSPCTNCKQQVGSGGRGRCAARYCAACRRVIADVRETLVEGMWTDGWEHAEIAQTLGYRYPTSINPILDTLRHEGRAPYRYAAYKMRAAA